MMGQARAICVHIIEARTLHRKAVQTVGHILGTSALVTTETQSREYKAISGTLQTFLFMLLHFRVHSCTSLADFSQSFYTLIVK